MGNQIRRARMADKKGRELERQVIAGDKDAALKLAAHGAKVGQPDFILTGLRESLPQFSNEELAELFKLISAEKCNRDIKDYNANPTPYEKSKKAFEIKFNNEMTLAEFCAEVIEYVEDTRAGQIYEEVQLQKTETVWTNDYYGGYRRTTKVNVTDKELLKQVEEAFEGQNGEFTIRTSGPLKIYAVQKSASPEQIAELEQKKKISKIKEQLEKQKKKKESAQKKRQALESSLEEAKLKEKELEEELNLILKDIE